MCERCVPYYEAVVRMVGDERAGSILWNATAYPFGDADQIIEQLGDAIVLLQLGRDPEQVADEKMMRAMLDYDRRRLLDVLRRRP